MGNWARILIGSKYELVAPKYEVPFSWSMLFDAESGSNVLRSTVSKIKKNISERDITFEGLEKQISLVGDYDEKLLRKMRNFVLDKNTDTNKLIRTQGYERGTTLFDCIRSNFDEEYLIKIEHVNVEIDDTEYIDDFLGIFDIFDIHLEYGVGSSELILLYELLIILELSDLDDEVILDLEEFEDDSETILEQSKQEFVNVGLAHDYLFSHTVDEESKITITTNRINKITSEDLLIDKVLMPLLKKMQFQNTVRIPYHSRDEKGVDIGPIFETVKFEKKVFYGVQAKNVRIHNNSGIKPGNIGLISGQIENALHSKFTYENYEVTLNKIYLMTSKIVTPDARTFAERKFGDRIEIFDQNDIAKNLVRFNVKISI